MRAALILLLPCLAACAVPSPAGTPPRSNEEEGGEGKDVGEPSDRDDLDEILEPIRASHDISSLALLMWQSGSVVAEGAVGVSDVDALERIGERR